MQREEINVISNMLGLSCCELVPQAKVRLQRQARGCTMHTESLVLHISFKHTMLSKNRFPFPIGQETKAKSLCNLAGITSTLSLCDISLFTVP